MDAHTRDHLAAMAAAGMADTLPADKRAARRYGRDRSTVNRWRNHGKGSPLYDAIQYVMGPDEWEAMRAALTVLSAARMRALSSKTDAELVDLYWQCRRREADTEHEDRGLDSRPASEWTWTDHAVASERDAATDTLKASLERMFAHRRMDPATVAGVARAWR